MLLNSYIDTPVSSITAMLHNHVTDEWAYNIHEYNCLHYREHVDAVRIAIQLAPDNSSGNHHSQRLDYRSISYETDVHGLIDSMWDSYIMEHSMDIIRLAENTFDPDQDVTHKIKSPRVIGIVSDDANEDSTFKTCRERMILDPIYPAMEQIQHNTNTNFFGNRFGVPFKSCDNLWYDRSVTTIKLLNIYSIAVDNTKVFPIYLDTVVDNLLPLSIPWTFRSNIMLHSNYSSNLMEAFTNGDTTQCDTSQWYLYSSPPETLDWKQSYSEDSDTKVSMSKLINSEVVEWTNEDLTKVNSAYRHPLKEKRIQLVKNKLVLFKPILANHRHVMLIIVPISLRRKLFSHYHAGPTCSHLGKYKIGYRIRLRFFLAEASRGH